MRYHEIMIETIIPAVPRLYHGTPAYRYEKIKHEGLVPSSVSAPKNPPGIYLSHQMSMAVHYAEMGFGEDTHVPWVILAIDGSQLDPAKLVPDTGQEMDLNFDELLARGYTSEQLRAGEFPWWVSLDEIGQVIYRGHISPHLINVVKHIA